ncbi:MAG: DNA polymerase/3'-5' exonuclease PolX [Gemmatimonadota bacterium]|nr:DNA polymerase/3'-5' exonuclease PolX [Gemmatimonadota bacterium]
MDSRTAAHVLSQISALLEIKGAQRFKAKAYTRAARAVVALDTDDLGALLSSGELAATPGIGPATLSVISDLVESGESSYLARLREGVPEGLIGLMRVPGLTPARIQAIHEELGIDTVEQLEEAARDGRLATLPKLGAKTAERILNGLQFQRRSARLVRYPVAAIEADLLRASVGKHPDVTRATVAGSVRRFVEVAADLDVVAECTDPVKVADSCARSPGVKSAKRSADARSAMIEFVDGTLFDIHCATKAEFPVALWRATGSHEHVDQILEHLEKNGFALDGDRLVTKKGKAVRLASENAFYKALGMKPIPPELREGRGEIEAALNGALPELVTFDDLRGVLHCHTDYSDGTATIAEMAEAARERGWSYIGISDHSEAAFYAGGLKRDAVLRQHDEIDEVNSKMRGFTVLKGIEADILADGRIDYDSALLGRFDFVIGSIHSRFSMDREKMTARVLAAMDDPHLTILAHPTGRLLLSREGYSIDLGAVIEKAADTGVAIEINADPARLDIDWRYCHAAKDRGVTFEIGPDAHSTAGLDNVHFGIGMARKGWLEAANILNARDSAGVLAFARARRK